MDLPNIFKPNINKDLKNNKDVYYSKNEGFREMKNQSDNKETPLETINRLSQNGYIFNKKVKIVTKEATYNTKIAGKLGKKIITLDNKSILMSDIISIEEI